MIYLDNAATTKPNSEVITAIMNTLMNTWGNPSSTHSLGLEAKRLLETSRHNIADFIGANDKEIIFTSGACESNSLALNICQGNKYRLIISEIEHKSIDSNPNIEYRVKVNNKGFVDLEDLESACSQTISYNQIPVVSIQWANGEIGTIQDIKRIAEIVHTYNGIVHTDATQMMADRYIDVKEANVDLLSFSGQKLGATKGIGVLYVKDGTPVFPMIYGSQEFGLRGGTENLPYIVGLNTALNTHAFINPTISDYFIRSIKENFPFAHINGVSDISKKIRNIISVTFCGYSAEEVLLVLSVDNIYASAGAACENSTNTPSRVLKAIGLTDEEANSTIRFSFSSDTTINEINTLMHSLNYIFKTLDKYK